MIGERVLVHLNMSIVWSLYSPFILSATHRDVYMGKAEGRANIIVCPKYRLATNTGKALNNKTFTHNMANRACILIS